MPVVATAPGKAVVAGEYAVLYGAPAISMAVTCRARVTVTAGDHDLHCVRAPDYWDREHRFRVPATGGVEWLEPAPPAGSATLFEAVWRHAGPGGDGPLAIELDTRAFRAGAEGRKLGVGSSAALALALAGALLRVAGRPAAAAAVGGAAHREFQDGLGSGVDIATAAAGGLVEFRRAVPVRRLGWPDRLCYRLLWSGSSASTQERLARLDGSVAEAAAERLAGPAGTTAAAWHGDADGVLAAMDRYIEALARYDRDLGLGIFAAGHDRLVRRARRAPDVVYKPCGAGGGDVGIVLAADADALDEFCAAAVDDGFEPLDLRLDADGLSVEGVLE